MKLLLKIVSSLVMIAFGFAAISLMFHLAQSQSMFAQATDRSPIDAFYQNAMFAWLAGIVISVGFYIIQNPLKYVFLVAPVLSVFMD